MGSTRSALASQPDALKDLFSQLDADHDGQISTSEFRNALGAGGTNLAQADDVLAKLDKDWRHGQPRRNVGGAEGQGSSPLPSCG
jgi:Ca2+-binding EF-hand superfamily protein